MSDPPNPPSNQLPDEHALHPGIAAGARTDEYQLPIGGFEGTPEEIERQWFERCYQGRGDSMWQLTWRAVLMGSVLGGILSLTNLYIGLKSGWGFGVAITACILSYAIWTTFHKLGLVRTTMTVLENNCMQSTASSAGYSTGGTLVSAIAAYILVNNDTIPIFTLMAWVFFLAVLGVTMAIPMKRQMINIEQLRFPSGIAAAETLRALHTTGGKGIASARALGIAGLLSAVSAFWTMGLGLVHSSLQQFQLSTLVGKLNQAVFGKYWTGHTVAFSWEPMFIAAGAITGIRVCTSMLIGGFLCWVVLTPWALDAGVIPLKIEEPLINVPPIVQTFSAQAPENVELPEGARDLTTHLEYVPYAHKLEWKGVMTPGQRDTLLGLSDDEFYKQAIRRLYVRSQYGTAAPLDVLPPGVAFEGDLAETVRFAPGKGLVAASLISPDQYQALRALSNDPAYLAAVDSLYEQSQMESVEPLWAAVPLSDVPDDLDIPPDLAGQLRYDQSDEVLLWRGPMSLEQQARVLTLSDAPAFAAAVEELHERAALRTMPTTLPADVANVLRFDPQRQALIATGPISDELAANLEGLSKEPTYRHALSAIIEASQADRAEPNFRDLVKWSLWGGAACMVTSALFSFAFQWRSVVQALASLGAIFSRRKPGSQTAQQRVETPTAWFLGGQVVGGIGIVILAYYVFGMPVWLSVLAIVLSFFLAIVACRVCGETDTTPVGAMGKVTQLMYGGITPGALASRLKMNINLMAACITAGAADSSSDLLIDLKSGYMLGANPRKQFLAQFAGIFMGTIASVTGFMLVVPNADALGTAQFPAPAAQAWAAVAKLLSAGFDALHTTSVWAIVIGGAVGILLPALEKIFPKYRGGIPSAAGLGLAFTFPFYYSLLFFLGAVIGLIAEKRYPKAAEDFTFPIASGVIAGEALMGVALIFIENGPQMYDQMVSQLFG